MLRWIDSCDHYATGDISEKYQQVSGAASVVAAGGRRGTAGLSLVGSSTAVVTFEEQPRWTVGLAMRYDGHSVIGTPGSVVEWLYGGLRHLRTVVLPEGFVGVTLGDTLLGQSLQALHTGIWYYLETSVLSDGSAGEALIHVDGVSWLALSGMDTQLTAGHHANQVALGSTHAYGLLGLRLDDIYICDGQGSGTFTTFLGDCRVDALYPNADGTHADWTPSTGTAHYALVNEHAPNDDTDYASETTGGGRDSYQLEPLPTMPNPEVLAVQALVSVRKEDVDEILVSPLLVSGATTSVSSVAHALTASYLYARDLWTADPNGGGAWTEAAVNSLQVGVERLA